MKPSREVEIRLQELVSSHRKLKLRNRDLERLLVDQAARQGELERQIRELKRQVGQSTAVERRLKTFDRQNSKIAELIDSALLRLDQLEEEL